MRGSKSEQPVKGFPNRLGHEARLTTEPIHIFEIGIDGRGLRQLTESDMWSDLDPTYLPSGDVAFVSDRCECSLQCNEMDKDETSCNLYVMRGRRQPHPPSEREQGRRLHAPCLNDGTIGYTRWEYLRARVGPTCQSLWFIRPDGTGADALFKQHFNDPWSLEDVRPIPGQPKSGVHCRGPPHPGGRPPGDHRPSPGASTNPRASASSRPAYCRPKAACPAYRCPKAAWPIHGGFFATPWPLSETTFLAVL